MGQINGHWSNHFWHLCILHWCFFTYVYNQQQLRIQEVQTIEKFLPRLAGDEQSKRAAILAISSLTNTELASRIAAIYASAGTASALQSIAQTGTEKEKDIASQALTVTLEKIASNQSKLDEIDQDLKAALLAKHDSANKISSFQDLPYNLNKLANYYILKGQYDLAEPLLTRTLAIRERAYGPENPQVVDVLKSLAELYKLKNNSTQADIYLLRAREIEEKLTANNQTINKVITPDNAQTIINERSNSVTKIENEDKTAIPELDTGKTIIAPITEDYSKSSEKSSEKAQVTPENNKGNEPSKRTQHNSSLVSDKAENNQF